LKAATGSGVLHVALADPARLEEAAGILERRLGHTVQRSTEGAELSVLAGTADSANEALAALMNSGIELSDFSMGQPSLDEVFFALTGQPGSSESQKDDKA
jgi:ABC-2 type transport system ATP-binding protein